MTPTLGVPRNAGQIHGRRIDNVTPSDNQILKWDDSSKSWKPGDVSVFGTWAEFSLTPVWTIATPTVTSIIARYVRNGNVISFADTINISDGKDAILESLDLPVAAPQILGHQIPLMSVKTWTDGIDIDVSDPYAYIDYNDAVPKIKFRISGGGYPLECSVVLNVTGSYEVV